MAQVLVIPYPQPGHLLPILDLSNQLALRGLTITILVTPKNLPLLQPLLSLHPSIKTLVLPFPSHPDFPAGIENMQELPISFNFIAMSALAQLYDPLLQWFQSHNASSIPIAIISDTFLSCWTYPLACRLGIKQIGFSPCNALSTLTLWNIFESDQAQGKNNPLVEKGQVIDKSSWGVILNTFTKLEEEMLDHIKRQVLCHERVWAVGPLLPLDNDPFGSSKKCGHCSIPEAEVLKWLDSCHVDESVVFIGFGSQVTLTKNQMNALAEALERSGVQFIWAIKNPIKLVNNDVNEYSAIPDGFENRTAKRGLVIKGWAPQQAILKHRAVGSYLSHCGWNSALEALLAGVLLLAWPMQADHFENKKLLVDELGVGLLVCEGLETVPDPMNLARLLAESVSVTQQDVRNRTLEIGKLAQEATKHGGSSNTALDELVRELSTLK